MRIGKMSAHSLIFIPLLLGSLALPCLAQRSTKSWDELIQYQADFLRAFYPGSVGKKYWITFEASVFYDEIGDTAAPDHAMAFAVDVGEGPKSAELMCCVNDTMGGIIGTNGPQQQKPAPLPSKPKPMNLGPHGEVYPNQYLRAHFTFDSDGRLSGFNKLPNKPPDKPDFWIELKARPDMTDAELRRAYKKSGAKYALGDREALERDLPMSTLETFVGRLKILKVIFTPTGNERIDSLDGFSACDVYLEGPEQKRYAASFDGFSGELVYLFYISEKDRRFFWDRYFDEGPG